MNRDELRGYFETLLPEMRRIARKMGYALAVHGSMSRDLDVVAVPWVESPGDPEELAAAFAELGEKEKFCEGDTRYVEVERAGALRHRRLFHILTKHHANGRGDGDDRTKSSGYIELSVTPLDVPDSRRCP